MQIYHLFVFIKNITMQADFQTLTEENEYHISADAVNTDEKNKVINHYNTFGLFDHLGNISAIGKMVQGIYHDGTRFLNELVLSVNGLKPLLLSNTIKEDNEILSTDLTNPLLQDSPCNIPENTIHIARTQFIRNKAFFEEITCRNYGDQPCSFTLSLRFGGDFRDIFEIRGIKRSVSRNDIETESSNNQISFKYPGLDDIQRETAV